MTVYIDDVDQIVEPLREFDRNGSTPVLQEEQFGLETDANELEILIRGLTDHLTEAEKRIYEIEQELTARAEAEADAESLLKEAGAAHLNTTVTA
jgi:chromosome segregation ATPase